MILTGLHRSDAEHCVPPKIVVELNHSGWRAWGFTVDHCFIVLSRKICFNSLSTGTLMNYRANCLCLQESCFL